MTTSPPAARRQLLGRSGQLSELVDAVQTAVGGMGAQLPRTVLMALACQCLAAVAIQTSPVLAQRRAVAGASP